MTIMRFTDCQDMDLDVRRTDAIRRWNLRCMRNFRCWTQTMRIRVWNDCERLSVRWNVTGYVGERGGGVRCNPDAGIRPLQSLGRTHGWALRCVCGSSERFGHHR